MKRSEMISYFHSILIVYFLFGWMIESQRKYLIFLLPSMQYQFLVNNNECFLTQLENQYLTKELVLAIEEAGPWGNEFSEPVFDGQFRLVSQRVVGEEHLKMTLAQGDLLVDAIAFRQPFLKENPEQVHVVYKLQMNRYAGSETIQLMVEYLEGIP